MVIPCFNYARFLRQSVGSALAQEGVDVEVIVVDDASTDDSLSIARDLENADNRVRVLANSTNQGPVPTFNHGLREVTGTYLVRLDADDLLTPGSLRRATALVENVPNVGLVYGRPVHFSGAIPCEAQTRVRSWTIWHGRSWLADRCRHAHNVITSPEVLMRTDVVRETGGQLELAHTHDLEMWLRIAAFSDVGYLNGPDQAWHREHDASLSARNVNAICDLRSRREAFDALFAGQVGSLHEAVDLLATSRRALANEALIRACYEYDRGRGGGELTWQLQLFAVETVPDVTVLRTWRALSRRAALGPRAVASRPWYMAHAMAQRLQGLLRHRRWARTGV